MLQIFRKDNTGLWKDVSAQSKVIAEKARASAPVPQSSDAAGEDSVGVLGLSGGSLENSLFGDKAWGEKLSYRRVRTALSTMQQFAQSPGKGSFKHRFSLSSVGSFRKSGFFGMASGSLHHSAGNGVDARQNSTNSLVNGEDSEGNQGQRPKSLASRWLCCACASRHRVRNHSSKLNTVLSRFDDNEEELPVDLSDKPGRTGSYYPVANLKASGVGGASSVRAGASKSSEEASLFGRSSAAGERLRQLKTFKRVAWMCK
jgi:hypothetical protein